MNKNTLNIVAHTTDSTTVLPNKHISVSNVQSSNDKPQPFVGSYLWRKHYAKDGPAPRNEEGMVIGRDT